MKNGELGYDAGQFLLLQDLRQAMHQEASFDTSNQVTVPPFSKGAWGRGADHESLRGGEGPQVRFRPTRYSCADFPMLSWRVTAQVGNKIHEYRVNNFSANGLSVEVSGPSDLFQGQTIEHLRVYCEGNPIYEGSSTVAVIRQQNNSTLYGLHLRDGLLPVARLLDMHTVKSAGLKTAEFLRESAASWKVAGCAPFKALLSDFRLFLEDTYHALSNLGKRVEFETLDLADPYVQTLVADNLFCEPAKEFCRFFTELDAASRILEPQEAERYKQLSRRHLHHFILQGPLFARSLAKPRGYAGDYMTMSYIYGRHFEGSSLFGVFVHYSGCQHDVCQAVRNRAELLYEALRTRVAKHASSEQKRFRIASVGAGPAFEIRRLLDSFEDGWPQLEIVLFDADDEALNYCFLEMNEKIRRRNLLGRVSLALLYDSIAHLLQDDGVFRGLGPFDVIVCAGLFDYLSLRKAQHLAAKLFHHLTDNGVLYIGNMHPSNPSRWAMEQLADWYLVYRTRQDLEEICAGISGEYHTEVISEPLGINLFLVISRADDGCSSNR